MSEKFKPTIGKNVIETLTMGMYDDPRFIYREYIQNSADAIDSAIKTKQLKKNEGQIKIDINAKKIIIEDNATGIQSNRVQSLLGSIATSEKDRYSDKGFRGIGRLGGLGYCDTLTFETTYKGETTKSIMDWDAKQLKDSINDKVEIEATVLVSAITDFSKEPEAENAHFFRVIMEGVTRSELLDEEKVKEYLSLVAPLPYSEDFSFKENIYTEAKKEEILIDEYNVLINDHPIFKSYKDVLFENQKNKDKVIDIKFFKEFILDTKSKEKELLYWGWYGITEKMQQIPDDNIEKFIRLRKSNIQIGLENRLDTFHKQPRGNQFYIGEVHAIHKNLIPNARRDYFVDSNEMLTFAEELKDFFHTKLYSLYFDFSKVYAGIKKLKKAEKSIKEYKKNLKEGIVESHDMSRLKSVLNHNIELANKSKRELFRLYKKYKGDTLANVIENLTDIEKISKQIVIPSGKMTSRFNKLPQSQKNLLFRVFNIIKSVLDKKTADDLINKIEEEI